MTASDRFFQLVAQRLEQLGLKPSAAEAKFGLKADTLRNLYRANPQKSGPRRPRIDTVEEICNALNISLHIGTVEAQTDELGSIHFDDVERLTAAIEAVEKGLAGTRKKIPPHKKAQIVSIAYDMIADAGDQSTAENNVISLLRAV